MKQVWVPFSGDVCPVDGEVYVTTFHRDGSKATTRLAKNCNWEQFGDGDDILAYCVSEEPIEGNKRGAVEINGIVYDVDLIQSLSKEGLEHARAELEIFISRFEVKEDFARENRSRTFGIKSVKAVATTLLKDVERRIKYEEKQDRIERQKVALDTKSQRRDERLKLMELQLEHKPFQLKEQELANERYKCNLEQSARNKAIKVVSNFLDNLTFDAVYVTEAKKVLDKDTHLKIVEIAKAATNRPTAPDEESALQKFFEILGMKVPTSD